MKKRMLTMLLALMLIVSVIPFAASAAAVNDDKCEYSTSGKHNWVDGKCQNGYYIFVFWVGCDAECTDHSYSDGACSRCGTACSHKFTVDLGITTQPTCTATGLRHLACEICGDVTYQTVAVKEHTPVLNPGYPATCIAEGRTDGTVCGDCGATITHRGVIAATPDVHDFKFDKRTREASCTVMGLEVYKCKDCGTTETRTIEKTAHTPVAYDEIPAKCGEEGRSGGKYCSVCELHLEDRTILDPLEHKYTKIAETVREATCEVYGLVKYECEYCHELSENKITEKAAHTPVAYEEIPATCEEDGRTGGKYCSVCEKHLEDRTVLKKLGHNITADPATMIGEAKTPATCTTAGSGIFRCANKGCDAYARRDIPALGHKLVTWKGFDATCLAEGRTDGEWCERCTKDHITKQRQVIPVKEHDFKFVRYSVGNEPTCLEDGVSRYECTTKGCTAVDHRATKALGHDDKVLESWPATCTKKGVTKYECQREGCPEKIRFVEVNPLGHAPEILPAVEATCSITGMTEGKECATCHAILEAQTAIEKEAHTWTDVVGKNATCTENGYTSHKKCSVCGTVEGKSVIEASHYYNDVRCTVCGEANPEYVAPGHGDHDKDDHNKPGHGGNHGHPDFIDPDDNGDNKPDQGGNNVESGDKDDNKQPSQGGNNGGSGDKDHNHRVCKHEHQTTVTQNKTCTTNGSVISYCTDCDTVITVTPDVATGHNFVMGACAVCGEHDPAVYTNDFNNYYIVGGSTK